MKRRVTYEKSRDEPEEGGEEAEGLSSLPLTAVAVVGQARPVESTAAARMVKLVDKEGESSEPGAAEEQVERVVQQVMRKGQQPDEGEEGGDGGDSLGVDLAVDWPALAVPVLRDEVADNADNDNAADKLATN